MRVQLQDEVATLAEERHLSASAESFRNRQRVPLGAIGCLLWGCQPARSSTDHSLIFWKSAEVADVHSSVKCIVVKEGDPVFIAVIKCYPGFYF